MRRKQALYFYRDPEGETTAGEKASTQKEFHGGWAASTPQFTAIQPEVTGWPEGAGARRALSAVFPTEGSASELARS